MGNIILSKSAVWKSGDMARNMGNNKNIANAIGSGQRTKLAEGLKKEMGSSGVTKETVDKALKNLNISGYKRDVIKKEIMAGKIGESNKDTKMDKSKGLKGIMDEKKTASSIKEQDIPKNDKPETRTLNFKVSEKNLRNAERLFNSGLKQENGRSSGGVYIPGLHKEGGSMEEIKQRLAEIQKKPDEQ